MTISRNSRDRVILSKIAALLGGYQAGFELVKGTEPDAIENFTMICSGGLPRVLLPPAQPMIKSAMASFLFGRRLAGLMAPCVQMASRAGGPFSNISSNVSLMSQTGKSAPLRQLISSVIGRNDFQIALRVSFGRPNAKTVALAISNTGEALCYAKLGSEAMTNDLVAHESAVLKQFEHSEMSVILPQLLYSGDWEGGHSVLITAPLQLAPLKRDARIAHAAADALVSQNTMTSSVLVDSTYWQRIIGFVEKHNDSELLSRAVAEIERNWGGSDFEFGVSHGDWTRANVGLVNGSASALDWERCTMSAPRGIDIAHFAICEKSLLPFSKSLNIERVAARVRLYLDSAGLHPTKTEPLILFALLEMVIRFKSAENAGLKSTDVRFGPALLEGLKKWAV